jgi:hypothetical protein
LILGLVLGAAALVPMVRCPYRWHQSPLSPIRKSEEFKPSPRIFCGYCTSKERVTPLARLLKGPAKA